MESAEQRQIRTTHGLCECCASVVRVSYMVRTTKVLCEFRTRFAQPRCCAKISHKPGAVVFQMPYLPHFSSKLYTVWRVGFLTSWALKWYIACRKWTLGSAAKVRKKTTAAVLFASLHFACFSSLLLFASLLYLACLSDPKGCQNTKTSHKYD